MPSIPEDGTTGNPDRIPDLKEMSSIDILSGDYSAKSSDARGRQAKDTCNGKEDKQANSLLLLQH
jgi:hypothetical protein